MNVRCSFESSAGQMCKRWAMRGSHFCHSHQPAQSPLDTVEGAGLHPLARSPLPPMCSTCCGKR